MFCQSTCLSVYCLASHSSFIAATHSHSLTHRRVAVQESPLPLPYPPHHHPSMPRTLCTHRRTPPQRRSPLQNLAGGASTGHADADVDAPRSNDLRNHATANGSVSPQHVTAVNNNKHATDDDVPCLGKLVDQGYSTEPSREELKVSHIAFLHPQARTMQSIESETPLFCCCFVAILLCRRLQLVALRHCHACLASV